MFLIRLPAFHRFWFRNYG